MPSELIESAEGSPHPNAAGDARLVADIMDAADLAEIIANSGNPYRRCLFCHHVGTEGDWEAAQEIEHSGNPFGDPPTPPDWRSPCPACGAGDDDWIEPTLDDLRREGLA